MSTTYIYIHGFNSDGNGWKAKALQRHFPEANIIAPDFPANPKEVMKQLETIFEKTNPKNTVLLGTSLGGFYAYLCSAQYNIPAYLFNPSLQPFKTLEGRGVGQFYTWTKKRDYFFSVGYLTTLKELKSMADKKIDHTNLYFHLATDDKVLDHSSLKEQYPKAQFEWYEAAGHSFSKFEKVLKMLKK